MSAGQVCLRRPLLLKSRLVFGIPVISSAFLYLSSEGNLLKCKMSCLNLSEGLKLLWGSLLISMECRHAGAFFPPRSSTSRAGLVLREGKRGRHHDRIPTDLDRSTSYRGIRLIRVIRRVPDLQGVLHLHLADIVVDLKVEENFLQANHLAIHYGGRGWIQGSPGCREGNPKSSEWYSSHSTWSLTMMDVQLAFDSVCSWPTRGLKGIYKKLLSSFVS